VSKFPKRIKRGSTVVSIYRTPSKGYPLYTVTHYDMDGQRCRRTFAKYRLAHKVAVETATKVACGKPEVHVLTGSDLFAYRRAMKTLHSTGVDLDVAATQYAHAFRLLDGAPLTEAVAVYMRQKQSAIQLKLVSEVADEMIKAKQEKGRSFLYLKDLRLRLARIVIAFPRPLAEITPVEIDKYLASLKCAPRTRNNFRLVFGTLLKFGQRRGYVPKDHPGISTIEKSTQPSDEVVVFTPEEMRSLNE